MRQVLRVFALLGLSTITSLPAHAAGTALRVWVSGVAGIDQPGCGTITSPCRQIQYALTNVVAPGGEIDIRDPSGFAPITITQSVNIINDGVGTASIVTNTTTAITIAASNSDNINLKGLTLNGTNQYSANYGIDVQSGRSISMTNMDISNFGYSVYLRPTAAIYVQTSIVNSSISSSHAGLTLDPGPNGAVNLNILNSLIKNCTYGVISISALDNIYLSQSVITLNDTAVFLQAGNIAIGQSTLSFNNYDCGTNGQIFSSFGNNQTFGNGHSYCAYTATNLH